MSNDQLNAGHSKSISVSSQRIDYEDSKMISDININNGNDQKKNSIVIQEAYFENEIKRPNKSKNFPRKQFKLRKVVNQSTQGQIGYNNDLKNLTTQE